MSGFKDVIGHKQAIRYLRAAIETGRVGHAYLISGPEGVGKKTLAGAFAQTLECERGGTDACGECTSCHQVLASSHPDLITVTHEKTSVISVDEIRGQVVSDAPVRPYKGKYKIYIIPEAEKMSIGAQNSLLKTLEEPPSYIVIMLLTVNAGLLLETIRSRCSLVELRPLPDALVTGYLMQKLQLPDYQARTYAAFAQGSIGKGMELAQSSDFIQIQSLAMRIITRAGEMDIAQIGAIVKEIGNYKSSVSDLLDIFTIWYRDVLYFKATASADEVIFRDQVPQIRKTALTASYEGLQDILKAISVCRKRLEASVQFDLAMELLLLTIRDNA